MVAPKLTGTNQFLWWDAIVLEAQAQEAVMLRIHCPDPTAPAGAGKTPAQMGSEQGKTKLDGGKKEHEAVGGVGIDINSEDWIHLFFF